MKNKRVFRKTVGILPGLHILWLLSCGSKAPGSETLLLYAKAQAVYGEGRFAQAAGMLSGERNFVPSIVLRGKAEYLSGSLAAAEKDLKRALALKPGDTGALLFLARVLRETGHPEEAEKTVEKILADNPREIRALRLAAELAGEKGAPGGAAAAVFLDRAVEASAEAAVVFLDRARLRWIGGNRAGALEDLVRARALVPQDSPVRKAVENLESIISGVPL